MSGSTPRRTPVPPVVGPNETEVDTVVDEILDSPAASAVADQPTVTISLDDYTDMQSRLDRAERPVLVKVKDAVVSHRRQLVLAGVTVATLGAAAFAVTHRDLLAEKLEETAEVVAEKTEHAANDVKQDARKARTGSATK